LPRGVLPSVSKCDREPSITRRLCSTRGCFATGEKFVLCGLRADITLTTGLKEGTNQTLHIRINEWVKTSNNKFYCPVNGDIMDNLDRYFNHNNLIMSS